MKRDADSSIPTYVAAILATVRAKPGAIVHIQVLHEPRCKLLLGGRRCTCSPEVRPIRPS